MRKLRPLSSVPIALLFLALASTAAPAQIPRPRTTPYNSKLTSKFLETARFTRTVTVDSGGAGDFASVKAACDFVAAQPGRSSINRWLIKVYPGTAAPSGLAAYDEEPFTVPSWSTLAGEADGWNNGAINAGIPRIRVRGAAGQLVTLEAGAATVNVEFFANQAQTGPLRFILAAGLSVTMTNTAVLVDPALGNTHPLDLVAVASGALLSAHNLTAIRTNPNSVTRAVVVDNGSFGATLYGGRFRSGLGSPALMENLSAASLLLFHSRLEGGALIDLKRSSTGGIGAPGVQYSFESGGIDNGTVRGDAIILDDRTHLYTGTGSPEPVRTAPEGSLFLRSDGPPWLYRKVAGGTSGAGWSAVGPVILADVDNIFCRALESFFDTTDKKFCVCVADNTKFCTPMVATP